MRRDPDSGGSTRPAGREADALVSYRIRTVRVAVYVTYMAVALMAVLPFVPGHLRTHPLSYSVVCLTALVGATVFGFGLPWPRLFSRGWGERTLYAWSALDIVLVTLAAAVTGGPESSISLLYVLTTVFFAASYPPVGQVVLFTLTLASYGTLVELWPDQSSLAMVTSRLAVVAMTWFMAAFLARERTNEMSCHLGARALAEHRAELLSAVARTASDIITLDADAAMAGVSDSLIGLGFDTANFCVLEDNGLRYRVRHARGLPSEYADGVHPATLGMVGLVSARRSTVVIEDYANHPLAVGLLRELPVQSVVAAPVWVEGELAAVMVVSTFAPGRVPATDVEVFEILAAQIGRALENAGRFQAEHEAVTRAQEDSRRDELTGLGNRRHANALLASLRPGDAVVLIDLDHFKDINDRHGHAEGDRVLVELAGHLRSEVRGGDDVARYGGEEFLVVLRQVGPEALAAAERLLASWHAREPQTTFSAGVACHSGDHPPDITVGWADAALYAAKTMGRDRVCLYGPELAAGAEVTTIG